MIFSIPEVIPKRSDFLEKLLDAVFPDLDTSTSKKGAYAYTAACENATIELGLVPSQENSFPDSIEIDSDLFRLMFEINDVYKDIFNKQSSLIEDEEYKYYISTLYTFCSQSSGSLKGWLKQTSETNRVNKSFDTAVFFTYLLLSRRACVETRKVFFEYCLKCLGVEELEEPIKNSLFYFNWNELGTRGTIGGFEFDRLSNRGCIYLGACILTILSLIGSYSPERDSAKIERLQNSLKDAFARESNVSIMMQNAEKALFESIRYFEPRSIEIAKKLKPQDFFVMPKFYQGEKSIKSPIARIKDAKSSQRTMIIAKTGLGKSAFLQMVSLCMLEKEYGMGVSSDSRIYDYSAQIEIPDDMFLISVPAYMFSFCFRDERYKGWTNDFVTLFFNCMLKLSSGINFFSKQRIQAFLHVNEKTDDFDIGNELQEYMRELAKQGKLMIILDSFDEISSGEMRAAYLRSLASFYDNYCDCPERDEIGAHLIISSREMSPETMKQLQHVLYIEEKTDIVGIKSLDSEQRRELVYKWSRFAGIDDKDSDEIIEQIEKNHYYSEYALNPYMLSVACFYFGYDLGSITQRYISYLVDRMLRNNMRNPEPIVQDVLMNITKILQDIAGETITDGNPHFTRTKLEKYISKMIDKTDLTEEDVESYIEKLHEIFVTEVGLIVPADGEDSHYQFINNQIRFELAARGIQRAIQYDEKMSVYRDILLPSINDVKDYVGLLVPLVCNLNLEDVQVAEMLVLDLAMYDFKNEDEEKTLIQAMMDLVLNRYGTNLISTALPGGKEAIHIRKAQRLVLIRLLSSNNFKPSPEEKHDIRESAAFQENSNWISDYLKKLLT